MHFRHCFGESPRVFELEHDVRLPLVHVLDELAACLEDAEVSGYIVACHTAVRDDETFVTTLVVG